jgi:hypothetical protein
MIASLAKRPTCLFTNQEVARTYEEEEKENMRTYREAELG